MPSLIGPWVNAGDTTVVDSSKKHELGSRAFDEDGNEYIYLQGVASTAAGSCVTYDEAHATTLAISDAVGRVAIAMAAIVADKYGWYQIYGKNTAAIAGAAITADKQLYLSATAGSIDDADAAGDVIIGMISRSAGTAESSPITVELNYPFVCDVAID